MKEYPYKDLPGLNNIEVEKGEVLMLPDGSTYDFKKKMHYEGGEDIFAPGGSKIFSRKLKLPKKVAAKVLGKNKVSKKISPASMSKRYDTTKYLNIFKDNTGRYDELSKRTAALMREKNIAMQEIIFDAQEDYKAVHGVGKKPLARAQYGAYLYKNPYQDDLFDEFGTDLLGGVQDIFTARLNARMHDENRNLKAQYKTDRDGRFVLDSQGRKQYETSPHVKMQTALGIAGVLSSGIDKYRNRKEQQRRNRRAYLDSFTYGPDEVGYSNVYGYGQYGTELPQVALGTSLHNHYDFNQGHSNNFPALSNIWNSGRPVNQNQTGFYNQAGQGYTGIVGSSLAEQRSMGLDYYQNGGLKDIDDSDRGRKLLLSLSPHYLALAAGQYLGEQVVPYLRPYYRKYDPVLEGLTPPPTGHTGFINEQGLFEDSYEKYDDETKNFMNRINGVRSYEYGGNVPRAQFGTQVPRTYQSGVNLNDLLGQRGDFNLQYTQCGPGDIDCDENDLIIQPKRFSTLAPLNPRFPVQGTPRELGSNVDLYRNLTPYNPEVLETPQVPQAGTSGYQTYEQPLPINPERLFAGLHTANLLTNLATTSLDNPNYSGYTLKPFYSKHVGINPRINDHAMSTQRMSLMNSNLPNSVKQGLLGKYDAQINESRNKLYLQNYQSAVNNRNKNIATAQKYADANTHRRSVANDKYVKELGVGKMLLNQAKQNYRDQMIGVWQKYYENQYNRGLIEQKYDNFKYDENGNPIHDQSSRKFNSSQLDLLAAEMMKRFKQQETSK